MITIEQLQAGIVVPIDKPRQWTSFQTVNKVKSIVRNTYGLKKFKIGHAGTLDPLATGLLLVCLGKATKTIPSLQDGDKVYTGTMVLGATTPCFDLEQPIDHTYPYQHITTALLDEARRTFVGTIMQVPPIFSAVKIEGRRAYEYARKDDPDAVIHPKPVAIHSFEITAYRESISTQTPHIESDGGNMDNSTLMQREESTVRPTHLYDNPLGIVPPHLPQIDFRIHCGKGTYIRSIARDFGLAIGSGAFLAALRRERVGQYTVDHALQLDAIEKYFMQNIITQS